MNNLTRRDFIKTTGLGAIAFITIGATVTLQWNPVDTATGYKIYWGESSGSYGGSATVVSGTFRIDVDPPNKDMQVVNITTPTVVPSPLDVINVTTGSIELGIGHYYFVVTAYNDYGESEYSEEVDAPITSQSIDHVHGIQMGFNVPPPPNETKFTKFDLNIKARA